MQGKVVQAGLGTAGIKKDKGFMDTPFNCGSFIGILKVTDDPLSKIN
jgi:hypothetical protein